MKKIVGIIEARMASSRLPGKVMLPVLGKPLLQHMIERLRRCYTLSDIVVATTETSPEIRRLCDDLGVGWFVGSEDDVLGRVLETAIDFGADVIVELTGDCPLIDPAMVDRAVSDYLLGGADFVWNYTPYGAPRGMDVRVFSTALLEELAELTDDPTDREHVSNYFWEHSKQYAIRMVDFPYWNAEYPRLTVDTSEDFEVIKALLYLFRNHDHFTLFDILRMLDEHPQIVALNENVEQKAVR